MPVQGIPMSLTCQKCEIKSICRIEIEIASSELAANSLGRTDRQLWGRAFVTVGRFFFSFYEN